MPEQDSGVVVTLAQMYSELARLTGELRDVNASMRASATTAGDHESRLRSLERWRYGLPLTLILSGGSVVVAALALWRP